MKRIALCASALALASCIDVIPAGVEPVPPVAEISSERPRPRPRPPAPAPEPTPVPAPQEAVETYRGLGTEPFWSIRIIGGEMVYEDAEERRVAVPVPEPRMRFDGRRYQTDRLTLDITHRQCSDGMSDRVYADTVLVTVGNARLRGCGGEILPETEIANTAWRIVEIDGQDVSREGGYDLSFEADRLSGRAGCNRLTGGYRFEGGRIVPGAIAATRMACPGPRMAHERTVLELLSAPVEVRFEGEGRAVISSGASRIVLQRAI